MSKTRKTRPIWVKVADRRAFLQESHHHVHPDVPCDLPDQPRLWTAPHAERTTCYWDANTAFWASPAARCGCRMCTMQAHRRQERRRERREGRRYTSGQWRAEYAD